MPKISPYPKIGLKLTVSNSDVWRLLRLHIIVNQYMKYGVRVPNRVLKMYLNLFKELDSDKVNHYLKYKDDIIAGVLKGLGDTVKEFEFDIVVKRKDEQILKLGFEPLVSEDRYSFAGMLDSVCSKVLRGLRKSEYRQDKREDFTKVYSYLSEYVSNTNEAIKDNYGRYRKAVLAGRFLIELDYVLVRNNELPNNREIFQAVKHLIPKGEK